MYNIKFWKPLALSELVHQDKSYILSCIFFCFISYHLWLTMNIKKGKGFVLVNDHENSDDWLFNECLLNISMFIQYLF